MEVLTLLGELEGSDSVEESRETEYIESVVRNNYDFERERGIFLAKMKSRIDYWAEQTSPAVLAANWNEWAVFKRRNEEEINLRLEELKLERLQIKD